MPIYHLVFEAFLLFVILWLLWRLFRKKSSKNVPLTKEEEDKIISEWKPEPLVPEIPENSNLNIPIIEGKPRREILVNGVKCLNFATHNYLGFAGRTDIEVEAVNCIRKFGVGSCGPRAFYGKSIFFVNSMCPT